MNGAHRGIPTLAGDLTSVCISKEDTTTTIVAIVDNAGATAWESPGVTGAGTGCWTTGDGTPALPVPLTEGAYSLKNAGATATDFVVITATVEPS
jgi:hypothetical protein